MGSVRARQGRVGAATRVRAPTPTSFDDAYYSRYYVDPKTRVDDDRHHGCLVSGVVSIIDYFGGELQSVLDVGAGIGRWSRWLSQHRPAAKVTSTELEPSICARYGHLRRDISRWRARGRFDLVVCQGVLPYLDDAAAEAAIENLAAMTKGFLYLEAITRRDLEEVCDLDRTDVAVHRRTGAWYRRRLARDLRPVGCGLYYARRGPLQFFELEAGD